MEKNHICSVCGYVYEKAKGDENGDIAPGTSFKDIPESWVCPVCGVDKHEFNELD